MLKIYVQKFGKLKDLSSRHLMICTITQAGNVWSNIFMVTVSQV